MDPLAPDADPRIDAPAPRPPQASTAPYHLDLSGPRQPLDPGRPWREAGRSHLATATRLREEARRVSGPLGRWKRTSPQVAGLRARAQAAESCARLLEPLRATGWVVLHDRVLAGTSAVLDHVLIGPPGIVVVQDRPTRHAGYDAARLPWADGVPLAAEREQARWAMREVLQRATAQLEPGWYVYAYPFLVLHMEAPWAPDLSVPACLVKPEHLLWALSTYRPSLAAMHVADLTMVVEDVCPPAPLQ